MPPFLPPSTVVSGFRERAESITVQGDRLCIGTSTGNLHIYSLGNSDGTDQQAQLVEPKKALSRRPIEQLGYVKDVNSLVVLTDSMVTLYPLSSFVPSPLAKTKGAFCFTSYSGVVHDNSDEAESGKAKAVPSIQTSLAVGCKRRIVIYSWKDGEPQDPREFNLSHSPRAMTFVSKDVVCFGYSLSDYALFSLKTATMVELTNPTTGTAPAAGMGMGALSGLSGYMTLGLGAKSKPSVISIKEGEALVAKDNNGTFVDCEGKPTREVNVEWPAPPEDLAFVNPYIFSILPPGSVPAPQIASGSSSTATFIPSSVVEIRSSISLTAVQTLPFPPQPADNPSATAQHVIRLLTSSPSAKSPLFLVSTPTDRASATAAGSSIWRFDMKSWSDQVDELVQDEAYSDALALLNMLDDAFLSDKEERQRRIRALEAVAQFRTGKFDNAINTFLELDINPAKIIALYPESVAGRLSVPKDEWIPLFGGPPKVASSTPPSEKADEEQGTSATQPKGPVRSPSPVGSIKGSLKTALGAIAASNTSTTNDDTASITGRRKPPRKDDFHRSIETLMRYLTDRRPKVAGALEALGITSLQSHKMTNLSSASTEELFAQPNLPLSALTPEQLVRFAQIVDTALFKSYLLVRPGLLGPLCRTGNWCEVSEVEEVLRAHGKFSELTYLYNGKKMHDQALKLLRELSEQEIDMRDKLMPSVSYLQRLGPEYLDHIFEHSRWVLEQDADIGFEIFTSEEVELPRQAVVDFLDRIDPRLSARYLEFLIEERGEDSPVLHDRLTDLYLQMTATAKKRGDTEAYTQHYAKLLYFIDTTDRYHPDRLYASLPSEDLYEAKAILLGRLGRHDNALEVYVYRLRDFLKAEEYCKRVYRPNTETSNVFLTLLRIYLRPSAQQPASSTASLLQPALELISRHGPRLDPVESLNLLPPLVTAQDVREFLREALRAPIFDTKVVREVAKTHKEDVGRHLMYLQTMRVKVTESRICPQCHKRIGRSVIAVHAPRGEVTHYQCREAFAQKLKEHMV